MIARPKRNDGEQVPGIYSRQEGRCKATLMLDIQLSFLLRVKLVSKDQVGDALGL